MSGALLTLDPASASYTELLVMSAAGPSFAPWNASLISVLRFPIPGNPRGGRQSPNGAATPMKETSICQTENGNQNVSQEGS